MEGTRHEDLRKQLEDREAEVGDLRHQLEQSQEEIDRLRQENEQLRKELKAAGRSSRHRTEARKKRPAKHGRPGRKAGKGPFTFRSAPTETAASEPPIEVPVTVRQCPCCGGNMRWERTDTATVTDIPEEPKPEVKSYAVEVFRCERCQRPVRGEHPDVAADQYGATAHRLGPRLKAAAHAVHYGMGVPVRKVPAILREFTGIEVTQSALTQDALKKAGGVVGEAYQQLRAGISAAPVVYTDDTSWRIHGQAAQLMGFDTDQATVFQIRLRHRNEEVRELIPADYGGVMVTDRGRSYEAEELAGVDQQKCLDHMKRNIEEVLEAKTGRARSFGLKLKELLREGRQLWREQRAGTAANFTVDAERIEQDLTHHLRHRIFNDKDNQRLLDGIGLQHDRGRVFRFLHNPAIEATNNRAERILRGAVIFRGLSHGSKNHRGAEAFAAFTSVIQTAKKNQPVSIFDALHNLFRSKSKTPLAPEAHAPPG